MKHIKSVVFSLQTVVLTFLVFYSGLALAQVVVAPQDFLNQVLVFIQSWGGISSLVKVSGIILLIIASMKVSFLQPYWAKLGSFQAWLAPILGLIAGVLGLGQAGPITAASVFTYISAGAGAIIMHELLDTVKAIPGIGDLWVTVIGFIEGLLGAK